MSFLRLPAALVLALAVLLSACDSDGGDDAPPAATPDIVQVAQGSADLETLVTALGAADLVETLRGDGPFTVFAPTDDAFANLPDGELNRLLEPENKDELAGILLYHVLNTEALSGALSDGLELTTANNGAIFTIVASTNSPVGFGIDTDGDGAADANITAVDNAAGNGVVHLIDAVLLPPAATPNIVELAQSNPDLETLVTALKAAELADDLAQPGPFTVFAPTDDAFAALPEGELDRLLEPENKATLETVLFFHVLGIEAASSALQDGLMLETANMLMWTVVATSESPSGFGIDTDGDGDADANIIATDITASNGIVHVIDQVLLPSSAQTITDIAVRNANFKELVNALGAVNLDETLAQDGSFTVFAPVNEAFAELEEVPTGNALRNVLLYHVLDFEAFSSALSDGLVLTTQNGGATFTVVASAEAASGFGIDTDGDGTADANIQAVDVDASNGVIHVIDAVLLPPMN
ncbi:MAG: fasciclin domain-containing protein [Bacteroidota bacterium]